MLIKVVQDKEKNRLMIKCLLATLCASVLVMVLTSRFAWGFWGWFGASFLLLVVVLGFVGILKGGAGHYVCTACGQRNEVVNLRETRITPCKGCSTYYEGGAEMEAVAQDAIKSTPVFECELPESHRWPEGCPVCRAPATTQVSLECTSEAGALLPVSILRTVKIKAPACAAHRDGVALTHRGDHIAISFRSHSYWRAFCDANDTKPRADLWNE